ncbi:MAG TPA: diaminopimelate decarboxylase [Phycisphaerales bacterium]|nr:diaminopimelate decarboxylase [Phycisphaerales bacterium]HMP38335.1 diaminopimelate decarboxylase [Phycisphaerales bacterium]
MDHFQYVDGALHAEGVAVAEIAKAAGTPTYVYSAATIRSHFERLRSAFAPLRPLICYSVKSCGNLSVCRLLGELGAGMDVVSGGELHRALAAGVDASRCVYAGVGKSDAEILAAIRAGIGLLNVESEEEFENIARLAAQERTVVRCALRINPDVDPRTHRYTSTGRKETKFGVDIERARAFFGRYGRDPYARLVGLHLHLGSPIYSTEPYVDAIVKTLALIDELARIDQAVEWLDLGGGFGADYESDQSPPAAEYAAAIVPLLRERVEAGLRIVLEPGRTIIANAGILLLRVLYMKSSGEKTFAICDAGMNALLRPSHYGSFHFIWPAAPGAEFVPARRQKEMGLAGLVPMDVVGPICESGDFLAQDRPLPPLRRGDLLAVFTAGAYGMSMANHYNTQPLPAEVLVDGSTWRLVRRRESFEELVALERSEALTDAAAGAPATAQA